MENLAHIPHWLYYVTATLAVLGFLWAVSNAIHKHGVWKGTVDESVKSLKELMTEIRNDVKEIIKSLPSTLQGKSPLELTDLGERISIQLSAKEWAQRVGNELRDQVVDMEDFEVQEFSESYLSDQFVPSESQDETIRKCIYEHGVGRNQVINVLMVELRDALLAMKKSQSSQSTNS